jgi:hypothetical protein
MLLARTVEFYSRLLLIVGSGAHFSIRQYSRAVGPYFFRASGNMQPTRHCSVKASAENFRQKWRKKKSNETRQAGPDVTALFSSTAEHRGWQRRDPPKVDGLVSFLVSGDRTDERYFQRLSLTPRSSPRYKPSCQYASHFASESNDAPSEPQGKCKQQK